MSDVHAGNEKKVRAAPVEDDDADEVIGTPDEADFDALSPERREGLISELSAERARLALALESGELGDWELDLRTESSPRRSLRHDRIFGYENAVEDWTFDTFLGHVHPEDRELVAETFRRALEEGCAWDFECRIIRTDGELRWIWARGQTHHDRDGNRLRMLGVVRDVTERLRGEEERQRLLAEAEAARVEAEGANRAKSEFLAAMSHELRTPINAMLGYVELLLLGVPESLPEGARDHVERVETSARHLLALIEEVLAFSRVEAGQQKVRPERVDLAALAAEAAGLMEALARKRGIEVRFVADADAVEAETDPARVRQILLNLLGNAVKFTEAGTVELRVRAEDEAVVLEVEDTGVGIDPSEVNRIFEPFRQAERSLSRRADGTGLGLSVTRQLTELLGGTVSVRSRLGEGSTFTVRLPRTMRTRPGATEAGR